MEYEKAYKDLIEKVEAVKKDPRIGLKKGTYYNGYVQTGIRDALEYITTEESEDERIRNVLIEIIRNAYEYGCVTIGSKSLCDEIIAYLKKQKDEAQKQFNLGIQAGKEEVLYEMEKGQKHTQTSDEREYVRAIKSIVSDFIRDKKPEDVSFYQEIYDWLDGRLIEQKPAEDKDAIEPTPKQDYSGLTDFERAIHRGFLCVGVENVPVGIIKDTAQDCLTLIEQKPVDWDDELGKCKKNPLYFYDKYVKIKLKPAEWSEEDIKHLNSILYYLNRPFHDMSEEELADFNWLKSIRPQPHWKPSEEQINALNNIILQGEITYVNQTQELITLKDELQKLL